MPRLRNQHKESEITLKRLIIVCIGFLFLFSLLTYRLYNLQITSHEKYRQIALKNCSQLQLIAPYRADIIDRNNKPLATYKTLFKLHLKDDLSSLDLSQLQSIGISQPLDGMILKPYQYAYLWNQKSPSFELISTAERHYPIGPAIAHLLGYTGPPQKSSDHLLPQHSNAKHITGHSGIEKEHDKYLKGIIGEKQEAVNAQMNVISSTVKTEPHRAQPLKLTIDRKLQEAAYDAMLGYTGSVIILNPNSGEILAAISSPSYDPHHPGQFELKKLNNTHDDQAMFNRISQSLYPPGSVIKPFIALMALQHGDINAKEVIQDNGNFQINENSRVFRDWKKNGHGPVNIHKAITVSCDIYFYRLAYQLGIDKLVQYLDYLKFGQKTNIDTGIEALPILPHKQYRQKKHKQWYTGQTIITGIGQGDVLCSPVQLARSTMLLANGGKDYPLHVIQTDAPTPLENIQIDESARTLVVDAMEQVMISGTGQSIGQLPYSLAGKTGSAQVSTFKDSTAYKSLPRHMKDHHLFIGFTPAKDPDMVIVVVVEHQHAALKVAKHILNWCWDNNMISESSAK